jgi:hypothetical protein
VPFSLLPVDERKAMMLDWVAPERRNPWSVEYGEVTKTLPVMLIDPLVDLTLIQGCFKN